MKKREHKPFAGEEEEEERIKRGEDGCYASCLPSWEFVWAPPWEGRRGTLSHWVGWQDLNMKSLDPVNREKLNAVREGGDSGGKGPQEKTGEGES